MSKIAVFPGSFDPITNGHLDIIRRGLPLFDKLIIAIGTNSEKKSFFPVDRRLEILKELFKDDSRIEIESYQGLTVDFCKRNNASYILRGLRTSADFEFEKGIGQMNRQMNPQIETVFFLTDPQLSAISSSIVRDILRNGGDVSAFIPFTL